VGGAALFLAGFVALGRSLRRLAGPIGEVMEAADRVAAGDYTARVSARGPGEVRRLGHAFNEMTEQLGDSDARRRRLLADVTHELRTPLSVIQGNLEAIADGVYEADDDQVRVLLEETRVMGRLLEDLQTLSSAEAGALRLDTELTDLGALLDEVVAAFEQRAAAGGVALSAVSSGRVEAMVDALRMRQVVENLVTNALRHTPAGGAVVLEAVRSDDTTEVTVSDTGPGIPADQLSRVFERYERSADSGGTGLGLAIARSLVEAHGGTIEALSAPGSGTTVRVRLPRVD
jgi:two-component system sensor histidine kinase BaeS